MADIKTKKTTIDPRAFVKAIADEQRRADCTELMALMQEITGQPAKMWGSSIVGFDQYRYKYASGREGEMLLTGFSPRKQDLVLYLGPGLADKALLSKLGNCKTGKGCLYVKQLADVDRGALRALIQASVTAMRAQHASGTR